MKFLKKYETVEIEDEEKVDLLEEQEFFDLLQSYRHTPIYKLKEIKEAFKDIKNFINDNFIVKDEKIVNDWLIEQKAKKYNI